MTIDSTGVRIAFFVVSAVCAACTGERSDSPTSTVAQPRISEELARILESADTTSTNTSHPNLKSARATIRDGYVLIDCTAADDSEALAQALEEIGMKSPETFKRVVSGWLPVSSIAQLQDLEELQFARPSMAQTNRPASSVGPDSNQPH